VYNNNRLQEKRLTNDERRFRSIFVTDHLPALFLNQKRALNEYFKPEKNEKRRLEE